MNLQEWISPKEAGAVGPTPCHYVITGSGVEVDPDSAAAIGVDGPFEPLAKLLVECMVLTIDSVGTR
jgi:hypothetical protein